MDAETFKKIFLPYHQKLYRVAYRILQDGYDSEDIVQETFIKLWEKRGELETIVNTEGFAITVLKNTCMDHLRKSKSSYHVAYDKEIPEESSLITQIEEQDLINQVQTILNKIPEQHRLVVRLKHWEACPDDEIEQITGLTKGNIKVILSRTRKAIKEQFLKLEKR